MPSPFTRHSLPTGLPTRYYVDPADVNWSNLLSSTTRASCAYKGATTGDWSIITDRDSYSDIAWSYNHLNAGVRPIAGLIVFYNEKVDMTLDGEPLEQPRTQFS